MVYLNKKTNLSIFLIFFISACQIDNNVNLGDDLQKQVIDENIRFEKYLSNQWEQNLKDSPIFASILGNKNFNQDIASNSIEEFVKNKAKLQKDLVNLNSFNYEKLNTDNKLNYKLKRISLNNSIEAAQYPSYYMSLNQRGGVQSYYETGDRLVYESKQDYEDWLIRLSKYADNIANTKTNIEEGLKKGYTQPQLVTRQVILQINNILNSEIEDNPYLKIFLTADNSFFNEGEKEDLINRATLLIKSQIIPAYVDLNNFLKNNYLPNSRSSIGLNGVPGGDKWYEYAARYHTTTNLTPDEIHDIGLREVLRIRKEMEQIITNLEWDGDFKSFLNYLRTSPRFYYDNPEDLLNAYLIMAKTIDPLLPKIFKVFPRAPYGVIPIPAESAPYTTTAYYNSPAKGRPGYFYANLYKPESRPKYEIPVLTVHEAVPGHHFQISIAQELENVPTFRKYQSFTAFVEGWGLYSEELGEFMNLYDDPYNKFGQLTYDMWRAIRLVVDTGMHYKNWSRQEAIDLFVENTAKSKLDIENEVDRYIAWPGQALAYKIGQLKMLELRNKAEKELGDKYDIKDFHYELLKRGSLPLDILEDYINDWIEESLSS
jgi:prolyl oligopeptidase